MPFRLEACVVGATGTEKKTGRMPGFFRRRFPRRGVIRKGLAER
jgi:hypothetical protein